MGCTLGKDEEIEIRSHTQLLKAFFKKKAKLEQELSKLNIRKSHSKFNRQYRSIKFVKIKNKSVSNMLQRSIQMTKLLKKRDTKEFGEIEKIDLRPFQRFSDKSSDFLLGLQKELEIRALAVQEKANKLLSLQEKLEETSKMFERNKKKIKKNQFIKDLCEGKKKSSQFLQAYRDRKILRSNNRISSISTAESESFLQNLSPFSPKIEDFDPEELENQILDLPLKFESSQPFTPLPRSPLNLTEQALYLKASLLLKQELNLLLSKKRKTLKKKTKISQKSLEKYERIDIAVNTDPEAYLLKLQNKIQLIDQTLDSLLSERDYLKCLFSLEKNNQVPDRLKTLLG